MSLPPSVEYEGVAWRGGRNRPRRARWLLAPTVLAASAAVLFAPLVLATPWAPVLHSGCVHDSAVSTTTTVAPGLLLNSPYGGVAWGNGSFDPHAGVGGVSASASDGSAVAIVAPMVFVLHRNHNATLLGPGADRHCTSPYYVGTQAVLGGASPTTFALLAAGAPTDAGESNVVPSAVPLGHPSVQFSNAFTTDTGPNIDTCHSGPGSLSVTSNRLTVWVDFVLGNRAVTVPITLPLVETFHYWFPAGAGSWSVDDLRNLPGAFGPGDAFVYAPCP